MQQNLSLVLHNFGEKLQLEETPIPELKQGQVLVKVQASTINPSDVAFINGRYVRRPLPTVAGLQGTGRVVKTSGGDTDRFLNKRVSFTTTSGSWTQYSVPAAFFQIDEDVSLASAASGVVNPLTVLGFLHEYHRNKYTGIIHTAAASSLGRMLNKICQTQNIPLLNVVRRAEQAELLKSEGATHVLVTEGDWVPKLKELIKQHKFNSVFDAIAGGSVTQTIIENVSLPGTVYIYGGLGSSAGIQLKNAATSFMSGLTIRSFALFSWWPTVNKEDQDKIRTNYSTYLKNELSTKSFKELPLRQIQEAIELSNTRATEGKILLRPN